MSKERRPRPRRFLFPLRERMPTISVETLFLMSHPMLPVLLARLAPMCPLGLRQVSVACSCPAPSRAKLTLSPCRCRALLHWTPDRWRSRQFARYPEHRTCGRSYPGPQHRSLCQLDERGLERSLSWKCLQAAEHLCRRSQSPSQCLLGRDQHYQSAGLAAGSSAELDCGDLRRSTGERPSGADTPRAGPISRCERPARRRRRDKRDRRYTRLVARCANDAQFSPNNMTRHHPTLQHHIGRRL